MKKLLLSLIALFAMISMATAQRAWAYDLELTPSVDSYTFAFKAVTAGDATLVFYKEGAEAGTLDLGSVSAGVNTVTKTSEELLEAIQQSGDFTWGVKMSAGAITAGATLTEIGSADFYNMMGVVVDNNPESSTFSQIYIQQAYEYTSGTTAERNKSQKAGIFIYDQQLNELNNPNNKGIVPNVPDAYKAYFGKNRDAMKRLAINPKTGQLAFCYNITLTGQAAAVWAMDLEELTPTAGSVTTVNLIDGITAFNKPNSLCFDEDGTLFVLADGGYSSTLGSLGTIYKIVDGTATAFSTFKYANGENAIASDGKGGLWVAQQRNNLDGFSAYTHHKADGEVDYTVTNKSSDEVKSLFQHTAEYMSKRGAIAYDVKRDILAVGGDKKVILFSVAYDATTGAPTLTKLFATPTIGGNIDGIAFDYAGDVYVVSSSSEKFQKFAVPTNNNTCTVPAKKVQVITLVSATPEYNVTINVNGNGTVTGANTGKYLEGTELTLTATPAEYHEFTGWTGDVTSTENLLTITVNSDMTVTANFAKKQYTLTVFVNDENKGTIDVATGSYEYGTEVTLTATPKEGYKLLAWSNKATTPSITLTMDNNKAVSAYFVKEYATDPTFTIEKVWENTNVPASTTNGYQAVGWDGKIYVKDRGNDKIVVYSDATTSGDYAQTDNADDQSIAVDDAGNLVLRSGSGFFYNAPTQIILYKKGETTYKTIGFTLPATGRCDFISASGDIFSEKGGYVYFFCMNQTTVSRLHIKNGEYEGVDTIAIVAEEGKAASQSHVVVDIYGNIHTSSKGKNAYEYNITTLTTTADSYLGAATKKTPKSTIGGCTFELGGKELWAYVAGITNYSSEWELKNVTDGVLVSNEVLYATDDKMTVNSNTVANWLNVQVEDEKTAYIYQFCPTVAAAVWKVSLKENYIVSASATNGTVIGTGTYQEGATATLTATPNTGYKFMNWTKGGVEVSTEATYSFLVTENVELVANFEALAQYNINAHADNTSKGYVTGTGDYYEGEEVVLKATAKTGYYFTQWNDGNPNNPRTITVTDNAEYIAEFAEAYPRVYAYDLDVADNGDSYTFSFKPNTNAVSGNLLLYSEDGTAVVQTHAISTAIVAHTATSITLNKTDLPDQSDIPWAIELSGNDIPAFAETFADSELRFARAHAVVDNSPESEYFGRVYVADRRSTKSNSKVYVYNPDFTDLEATNLGLATAGYSRPAVGADGTLYLTGYTDGAEAGIFVVDPADLTKCTQFFNGTPDADGLYTNNGREIGSSTSGVGVYGSGKDAVLYTMMEDGSNANFISGIQPIVKYQIGQENGTVLKQWSDEPTWWVNYPAKAADKSYNFGNNDFAATAKGVWVSQNKSNPDDRPEIAFVDKTGTIQLMQNSKKCLGGGMTVNADNTVLYIVEDSKILEYAIAWNENTPSLTLSKSYPISLANVSTLSMDYAGNLIACAGVSYTTTDENKMKVVCFTLPTDDNHSIVPAAKSKAIKLGARYTVTVVVNDDTMGEVIGAGSYKEGEIAELAAAPAANHRIVNWKKGDEVLSTELTCSFEVTEDVTINVTFEKIPQYTITTIASPDGKGTITGGGLYNEGTNVNLTATAHTGYTFVKWEDDDTAEATRTITVTGDITYTAIFDKVVPRAWAYALNMVEDGEDYKFSFTATSAGNATIIFTDEDGNTIAPTQAVVGAVTAGENKTVNIAKTQFIGTKDIYWSVKVDGAPIEKMAEITDPSLGIYDIVAPQGIAIDNNTDSEYFGQVYVAAATDGEVSRGTQTRGIFVYNPILNELNTPNTGYLPANATLTNTTRQAIHRVAVNPTNSQVAFAYNISSSTAVWSMNPENLAGDAVNLIDGAGITKANSICFDENGILYVMDNANTGATGGQIYKVEDGVATLFAAHQAGYQWATEENSIVSDGRGGLWIAQNRWSVDTYPVLSHVNKDGIVDFAVTTSSPEALKALFPYDDNNASYRGQCAYYVAEDILAFAGNKEAVLFKITYDANDVPTNLEKLMSTGKLGTNIDGVAFDYAGDLYVASETTKRFYKFVVPTNNNTCTVPAPASQVIKKEQRYTVTVSVNDDAMGTATGGGEYKAGETIMLTATANAGYRFVNWTKDSEVLSSDASFTYTVPAENVTIVANFEEKPLEMVGVVKRAVQIGESVVVLTHETDGTPHLYKVVDGELAAEISQEGVIARDPENAGDYLSISDIAATEDGKLVAINKIVCQSDEGQVVDGYKRGETRVYKWDNIDGTPSVWFTSKQSSNWYKSIQGHTMAYKGTSTTGTLFTTGVTATGEKFRYSVYNVIDGVYDGEANNNNTYFHFTKGSAQTTTALGENYELNASSLATTNWILDGGKVEPFEIIDPLTYNTEVVEGTKLADNTLGKKFNGATYLTVNDKHLIVAPYADGENVAGIKLLNVTDGLDQAELISAVDLPTPLATTAAATAVKVDDNVLSITLVTDATLHTLSITLEQEVETYTRSELTAGNFGTICLPWASISTQGAVFFEIAYKDGSCVYMDQVTQLEAGVPYIFKATAEQLSVTYDPNTEVYDAATNVNGLYGTFVEIVDGELGVASNILEGNYIIFNNELRQCGARCKLGEYRAYVDLEEVSTQQVAPLPGRQRIGMSVQGENSATALDNIYEGSGVIQPAMEGTYDVLGRKLTQPTTTGVYIINGKKVFVVK